MKREVGPWSAGFLVVANMIGTGAFTTSGFALAELGSSAWVLLAWAIGGVVALCGALSYGGLARAYPQSGGEYHLLSRLVHPIAGLAAGWVSILAGFTAPIAAAALAIGAYWGSAEGPSGRWLGTAAILVAAGMHGIRRREGLGLQNAVVVAKLIGMSLFAALVLWPGAGHGEQGWAEVLEWGSRPGLGAISLVLVWISFAYSGWNAAIYIGGEVRDPDLNLQRGLLGGTLAATVLYLAFNAALLAAAPAADLSGRADAPAIAAQRMGGPAAGQAMAALIGLALFTSISSMMMAGPRVISRMAEDRHLPGILAGREDAPSAATMLQACLAIGIVWVSDLVSLLSYIGLMLGLCAAGTVGAGIWHCMRNGAGAIRMPFYPWVPGLYVMATLAVSAWVAMREPAQVIVSVGFVALVSLTALRGRGRRQRQDPESTSGGPSPTRRGS